VSFILSIDCCSRWTNVGCASDGVVLGEIQLNVGRKQSALLPGIVDGLLRSLDKSLHDIDCIAVTTGPGYFTGLRVGVSYATALAEALSVPVVPVGTLEAMVYDLSQPDCLFVPLLWARREEVYGAIYEFMSSTNPPVSILPPMFIPFQDLIQKAYNQGKRIRWVGEDVRRFSSYLAENDLPVNRACARAGNVALIGQRDERMALSPWEISVNYLRGADMG
jgi:tRNA threonylcarbamoyladenosine biosynthesis protein TsaB